MSLKKCPECSGRVSSAAKTCPHCGHPMTLGRRGLDDAKDTIGSIWSFIWVAMGLILFVGMCSAVIK